MITQEQANNFAQEWIAAWNAHDIERVLSHYTEDFTIETPVAAVIVPESNGIVKGKAVVRAYWSTALQRIPNLKFELYEVLIGINGITIYYTNTAKQNKVAEVLWLNDELKAYRACVYYA